MTFRSIAAVLMLVALAGCSTEKSTTTTPTPAQLNLTGRWTSDVTFQGITTRMSWTLTQSGSAVTGPVTLALPTGTVLVNGTFTGTLTGSSLPYVITVVPGGVPAQPACSGQMTGTMTVATTGTSMSGNVAVTSSTCALQLTSTVTMTKQ